LKKNFLAENQRVENLYENILTNNCKNKVCVWRIEVPIQCFTNSKITSGAIAISVTAQRPVPMSFRLAPNR
jgi:hypothetical protein